jgi:hypothetical protein
VTVVEATRVSNYNNKHASVTVHGQKLGSVSPSGIYTPVLQGDGSGGVSVPFTFGMKRIDGQWRIDTLTSGLILSYADFQKIFQQHTIYFYDLEEKALVPDPRFSSQTDRPLLANWLVSQLAAGARPALQDAVITELPAQTDPRGLAVLLGSPNTVEVPRSSQLDVTHRALLAGQLALTLQDITQGTVMSILDAGRPITVSSAGNTRFAPEVAPAVNRVRRTPSLFYLHSQAVVDAGKGSVLAGPLGTGQYGLTSIALGTIFASTDLLAAGTAGPPNEARLLVGTKDHGLVQTSLRGRLTRPTWAPGHDEVWVGDGARVYRVSQGGRPTEVPVAGAGTLTGAVRAVRFSPEGSRVALVLSARDGESAQVWVGVVIRSDAQAQVRVDNLEPISPQGVIVTDVAWNDELKLFTIGTVHGSDEGHVYEVQVDGSLWTPRSTQNLPGAPDSITVAQNAPAWVSVGTTVWAQRGGTWAGPNDGTTFGINPVYQE